MRRKPAPCIALLSGALLLAASVPGQADFARAQNGMVASVDPIATRIGVDIMKRGGNAVDAAVAVGLALGVVNGYNSGVGGGCFMLIHRANGEIIALDGREMAPGRATRDMFVRDGKGDTHLSQTGALASGIPGSVAVYERAVQKYGRLKFADSLLPSAQVAEDGFPLTKSYVGRMKSVQKDLLSFPASREIYFKADGTPLAEGDVLRQPDLARSYRAMAKQGAKWFYRGDFAKATEKWMKANGGITTARDFANYKVIDRKPIYSTYRGFKVVSFPPPSSGGVHVAQILNILSYFNLATMTPADREHVLAEAMKRAFADRAFYLGDPAFTKVPVGLVNSEYARSLAAQIQLDKAVPVKGQGDPYPFDPHVFEKHTTHFSTADKEGNWVACTSTVNTSFGSKVTIPGTGIVLNDQMDDFAIQPGTPNAFGLIGGDANSVAPGKRPLSSMSPTIVLQGDKPFLALGAAGGPTIITQTVQAIVGAIDLRLPVDQALALPRLHQQWVPDSVRIETTMPAAIRESLRARGHVLDEVASIGAAQVVGRDLLTGELVGASEPRVEGLALGF
ncbi:gamma-glutamyltransferase [bacterium]|nr:MAG: gamma-glutamyltransferase [bacterium]